MKLTRRERRELAALGERLAQEDADLAAQLSRPIEPAPSQQHHSSAGVLIGQVLFVVALLMTTWGVVMSTSSAITIGAIVFLACWVPWLYGSGTIRR
ncbi:DUF3040 domain-containing protein [Pseudonocardia sp. NPDC049154]|uniref:DUF3040 domain-containing protein n=1 Tax=Pseudonocardia sp. NPDC049154 TaxID=3155501 RepID=UPI0033FD9A71